MAGLLHAPVWGQAEQELGVLSERVSLGTVEVKRNALLQLARMRSDAASRIAEKALRDESEIVRATAIRTVVFLSMRDASSVVIPFLSEKSQFIRKEALFALADIGDPNSAPHVARVLLSDKKREVRATAAYSLGRIGNPLAVDALVSVLKKKPGKKRAFLRRSAARSLGQIAQRLAGTSVSESVPHDFIENSPESTHDNRDFKEMDPAVDVLIKVLVNPKEFPDTSREAAFALGAIGSARARSVLTNCASGPDYVLAQVCRESLSKLP